MLWMVRPQWMLNYVLHQCKLVPPSGLVGGGATPKNSPVLGWPTLPDYLSEGEAPKIDSLAPPAQNRTPSKLVTWTRARVWRQCPEECQVVETHVGLVTLGSPRQWAACVIPQSSFNDGKNCGVTCRWRDARHQVQGNVRLLPSQDR